MLKPEIGFANSIDEKFRCGPRPTERRSGGVFL